MAINMISLQVKTLIYAVGVFKYEPDPLLLNILQVVHSSLTGLNIVSVYLFIFDMRAVRVKIQSENYHQYKANRKANQIIMGIILALVIIFEVVIYCVYVYINVLGNPIIHIESVPSIVFILSKMIRWLTDMIVIGIFCRSLAYFYN